MLPKKIDHIKSDCMKSVTPLWYQPGGAGVTGTTRRVWCYRYTALATSLWYQEEWVLQIHSTNNIIVVPGGVGITGRISHIFHTVTFYT